MKLLAAMLGVALGCAAAWVLLPPLGQAAHAQSSDATPLYPQSAFAAADGRTVYQAICQGCHMAQGQGAKGAGEYPALAGNPKLAAAPYVAMMVLDGHGGMPAFGDMLNDTQAAGVVDYVRTHFGNDYPGKLTAEDVRAMRH
ncbi:MAG: cytochrome c [Pseudoxanthomonas sp.]